MGSANSVNIHLLEEKKTQLTVILLKYGNAVLGGKA